MPDKFQNKYRIPSARASRWNYGNNATYFITICTRHREHYFGEIVETRFIASVAHEMQLSELGKIAGQCWNKIPKHFPFVMLDEFVVMPNHVHGIIAIDKPEIKNNAMGDSTVETRLIASVTPDIPMETRLIASLQNENENENKNQNAIPKKIGGFAGNKNPMLNENLSRVLQWYKGRTTFECKKIRADFGWQSRFHDHIIRDDESYQRIKNYIITNPQKWDTDKFKN